MKNELFRRLNDGDKARSLLVDAGSGSAISGPTMASVAGQLRADMAPGQVLVVLCSSRLLHAAMTSSGLAAGLTVLPLEPELPSWMIKDALDALATTHPPRVLVDRQSTLGTTVATAQPMLLAERYLDGSRSAQPAASPPPGILATLSADPDGRHRLRGVAIPRLWAAAREIGRRLGMGPSWIAGCIDSLGTPGTYVGDIMAAVASGGTVAMGPRCTTSGAVDGLLQLADRNACSYSAPSYLLRHLLHDAPSRTPASIQLAVCTDGPLGGPAGPAYRAAVGHPVISGLASYAYPMWGALASIVAPNVLSTGLGMRARIINANGEAVATGRYGQLSFRPESHAHQWASPPPAIEPRTTAALHGRDELVVGDRHCNTAPRPTRSLGDLDRALMCESGVIDCYSTSGPAGHTQGVATLVVPGQDATLSQLDAVAAAYVADRPHAFIHVSEVPRLPDGRPITDDIDDLTQAHLEC